MKTENLESGPHQGERVLRAGSPVSEAKAAMIMIHGRGARAEDILSLSSDFSVDQVVYLAPQAAGNTWYPFSFLYPIEQNEPGLSSGLLAISELLLQVAKAGIPRERVVLLGFSQGACLALEYSARHAQRYGGVVGLSGGLIGPEGTPRDYPGSLEGTPVFLGCSDVDSHVPLHRVEETASVMRELEGHVTKRIYPGMAHTVNMDEIEFVQQLLRSIVNPEESTAGP